MSTLPPAPRLKTLVVAPLTAIFLQTLSLSAHAEVQVSGEVDAIRIEASDASIEEVLAALSARYGLQARYQPNLGHSVSGTFAGSLAQVLSRLLQGYNYVVETSAGGTRVVVYDLNAAPGNGINVVHNGPLKPQANPSRPAASSFLPPVRRTDRKRSVRARRPPRGQ